MSEKGTAERDPLVCAWDGIRNHEAKNRLKQMAVGDQVLFYHSGEKRGKKSEGLPAVVATTTVDRAAYPDPSMRDENSVRH